MTYREPKVRKCRFESTGERRRLKCVTHDWTATYLRDNPECCPEANRLRSLDYQRQEGKR